MIKQLLALALSLGIGHQALAEELPFSPLPDSKVAERLTRHYSPFELITGIDNGRYTTQRFAGQLKRINYKLPASYLAGHAVNNYKAQIEKLGGSILFECLEKACGDDRRLSKQVKPLNAIADQTPALLTAKLPLAKKQLYLSIYAANWHRGASLQLDIIEIIDEPLDLLSTNQAYLASDVTQTQFKDRRDKDIQGASDHPMIDRLPGAYIQDYLQQGFGQTVVFDGVDKTQHQLVTLEGKITDIGYKLPRRYSEFEVDANYKAALEKLGFVRSFHCQGLACGKTRLIQRRINTLIHIGKDEDQYYSLYRLDRPEGAVHVMVFITGFINGLWGELRVVEETKLVDDRVVIDLEGLTDKIAQNGHVALDGLLFKFDSDEMLPEADEVITTLATYLTTHPKQRFYVVGHTDDQGKQSYNQVLSERRAKAVVKALTSEHKISSKQLTAKGIGEYVPVANNFDESGRKLNRRVELVLRSDVK
ncbi:OmpA family protein [Vibrio nereis]|uniref:OmpA family protein n=1 Tax=Vibrio nereis TaxID=693 RepID=UPI002493F7EC|nr:OmpA family protein [Vibrio nereis]